MALSNLNWYSNVLSGGKIFFCFLCMVAIMLIIRSFEEKQLSVSFVPMFRCFFFFLILWFGLVHETSLEQLNILIELFDI